MATPSKQSTESLASGYSVAGPILWALSIQYFVAQVIVASAWKNPPYSWRLNAISDLGATRCGSFDGRLMCSPLHPVMNASFIVLGVGMAAGSALTYRTLGRGRPGFVLMAAAGIGTMVVGFVPLDTVYWLHLAGADVALVLGNIALIVLGRTWRQVRWLCWYSLLSAVGALAALCLFLTHNRFFLGLGGMERAAAYPQTVWLIVVGLYLWTSRMRTPKAAQGPRQS